MKSVPDSIEISTLRCVLRALCETDIPAIASGMSDPGIADAVGWNLPCDPLALVAAVRASEVKWQTGTGFHFSIVSRSTAELLGGILLRHEPRARDWSIGFWICRQYWGQGYAVEAARALTEFAFARLQALTVRAAHAGANRQSRRVIEKLGMRFNRQLAAGVGVQGWVSEYEYAIEKN